MRSISFEMGSILGEGGPQVHGVDDEDPIEDLSA
jgi:hypothetical protein